MYVSGDGGETYYLFRKIKFCTIAVLDWDIEKSKPGGRQDGAAAARSLR